MIEKKKRKILYRILWYNILFLTPMMIFAQKNFTNGYSEEQLKPIRENFKRINSITDWGGIITKELWETTLETLEGGDATFYYQNGQLEKIVMRQAGETYQIWTEYYLLNGQLSFAFKKLYRYNRPFYYDLAMMEEDNDTEMFDFDKSEIIEDRCYFENGELIHHIKNNKGNRSPLRCDIDFEGEKTIKNDFDELIKFVKKE